MWHVYYPLIIYMKYIIMYYSVKLISAMGLCIIIVWTCFIIPVVSRYHYNICVSLQSKQDGCHKESLTLYTTVALWFPYLNYYQISAVPLMCSYKQECSYSLKMSYTLRGLHNIQIRSNSSKPAVITCQNNSDVNTGVAL